MTDDGNDHRTLALIVVIRLVFLIIVIGLSLAIAALLPACATHRQAAVTGEAAVDSVSVHACTVATLQSSEASSLAAWHAIAPSLEISADSIRLADGAMLYRPSIAARAEEAGREQSTTTSDSSAAAAADIAAADVSSQSSSSSESSSDSTLIAEPPSRANYTTIIICATVALIALAAAAIAWKKKKDDHDKDYNP